MYAYFIDHFMFELMFEASLVTIKKVTIEPTICNRQRKQTFNSRSQVKWFVQVLYDYFKRDSRSN